MKKRKRLFLIFAGVPAAVVILTAAVWLGYGLGRCKAETAAAFTVPDLVDAGRLKFDIIAADFVTEATGANDTFFREMQPALYRGMILTIAVDKPADYPMTFYSSDFSLRYEHGGTIESSVCYGLSEATTDRETDRILTISPPGSLVKVKTGRATTHAERIYMDLLFQYMEQDTSGIYLAIAQATGAFFTVDGWG